MNHRLKIRKWLACSTVLGTVGWASFGWHQVSGTRQLTAAEPQPAAPVTDVAASPTRKRSRLLVLLNGSVIQGKIARERDDIVVSNGPWYSIRVPRRDVDFVVDDFQQAYTALRDRLEADDLAGHLQLARWCLRHDLDNLAGQQLVYLFRHAPDAPAVQSLEQQLKRRVAARQRKSVPAQFASQQRERQPEIAAAEAAEAAGSLSLDSETIREFTRFVQPLLLNRCGQTTCHGSAAENGFQLVRTPGGSLRKELTWQNMRAVLQQIERQDLKASPLLIKAVSVHGQDAPLAPGQAMEPIEHETAQLRRLMNWISQVAGNRSAANPINSHRTTPAQGPRLGSLQDLYQPHPVTAGDANSSTTADADPLATRETPAESADDPFDPAAFNRQAE